MLSPAPSPPDVAPSYIEYQLRLATSAQTIRQLAEQIIGMVGTRPYGRKTHMDLPQQGVG